MGLSPIVFAVYMDGLFACLRNISFGCHTDLYCVGRVGIADISLLAPSNTSSIYL